MDILTTLDAVRERLRPHRQERHSIGLVPTMGYLHEGHLSLMKKGRSENHVLVATIFVNPTQFGPSEDLEKYPRDPEGDAEKCRAAGVDVLFVPEAGEVYGPGFQTYVTVEKVSGPLCGASRPGHFRGVATVVLKLFNMVQPSSAYFGRKDYQQVQVIKTMVRDLNLDVRIVECDTIREYDGLAMSSRNAYLLPGQRKQAVCLYQALMEAKALFKKGEQRVEHYLEAMRNRVNAESATEVDYIGIVHPETLEGLDNVGDKALGILAVRIGSTRLIDNMLLNE
jgi:pantoate--beta-alanine ligase